MLIQDFEGREPAPDALRPNGGEVPRDGIDRGEAGQDLVEYAILSSLIVIVVIGAMTMVGQRLQAILQGIVSAMPFGGS